MRRTKEDAAKTRQDILHAAKTLFLEQGYEKVTLEHIAACAGVTRGAIHWHFKSKQGMVFALRDEARVLFRKLADRFTADPTPDPLVELRNTISSLFEKLHADPRQRGVLRMTMHLDIGLGKASSRSVDTFKSDIRQSLLPIFEEADRREQLIPPWTPVSAARSMTAVISGLVGEWALENDDFALLPDGMNIINSLLQAWSSLSPKQL